MLQPHLTRAAIHSMAAALFLLVVSPTLTMAAQTSGTARTRSSLADSAEAAVDRLMSALNANDSDAVFATFGQFARGNGFSYMTGSFDGLTDIEFPREIYGRYLRPGVSVSVDVLDRMITGSFVMQLEAYSLKTPDGEQDWTVSVLYRVQDDRVQTVWFLPWAPGPEFAPSVDDPAFPPGTGPVVYVDAAHHNMHTTDGSFWPFAELLRRDGYVVRSWHLPFDETALDSAGADVLVIANALNRRNAEEDWSLPTPSAFTSEEVVAVRDWVEAGGALLLIADHMPFPGAAHDFGSAFGVEFQNGYARDSTTIGGDVFRRSQGTLLAHSITDGSAGPAGRVDSVATFGGQAWPPTDELEPLIVMSEHSIFLYPTEWGEIDEETPSQVAAGWVQGGVRRLGAGRIALFGEAMLFWAALTKTPGTSVVGQNAAFVRNLMLWLVAGTVKR